MIKTKDYDIMIDCGEGSYLRLQKAGYQWNNLKYILITHMHPDHVGGLLPFLFYIWMSQENPNHYLSYIYHMRLHQIQI